MMLRLLFKAILPFTRHQKLPYIFLEERGTHLISQIML